MNELSTSEYLEGDLNRLFECVYDQYGYDFREYAKSSQQRRVIDIAQRYELQTVDAFIDRIRDEPEFFSIFLDAITITVTELYRDPAFYEAVRDHIFPYLKTYSKIKIWHAGCATGEEVYSLAMLLHEAGLYERSLIYATDINPSALLKAKSGVVDKQAYEKGLENYKSLSVNQNYSNYFLPRYDSYVFQKSLLANVVFSDHNLCTDQSFAEMQLIFCRNVMIYFDRNLQNKVLNLFAQGLVNNGFLCLGSKESLSLLDSKSLFNDFVPAQKIYRRKSQL